MVATVVTEVLMKLFLDTANLDEIREAHSWGIIDGVTQCAKWTSSEQASVRSSFSRNSRMVTEPSCSVVR